MAVIVETFASGDETMKEQMKSVLALTAVRHDGAGGGQWRAGPGVAPGDRGDGLARLLTTGHAA